MSITGWLDPITRKRLQRFREYRRAYYSLLIIVFLYLTSLVAEVFCNDRPLYVHYQGKSYFPVLFFYPEDTFTGNGLLTRPDYKAIDASPDFSGNPDNYMVFPLVPFGPNEIIPAASVPVGDEVEIEVRRAPRVASVNIDRSFTVRREQRAGWFFPQADSPVTGMDIRSVYELPEPFIDALELRFANRAADPYSQVFTSGPDAAGVELSLSPYKPRSRPPQTVRILLREVNPPSSFPRMRESSGTESRPPGDTVFHWMPGQARHDEEGANDTLHRMPGQARHGETETWLYTPADGQITAHGALWNALPAERRDEIRNRAETRVSAPVADLRLEHGGADYRITFNREDVRFPFRPVGPHLFGLDDTGRDVLARIFYGLRTSLNFGLLLVMTSMVIGTMIGSIQGYYGGRLDLTGQRLTEIWEALPFLYVLILLGSVYGRSFVLLLVVYGLFNWIGISYYMRAEFLRLRNQQFVEAAQCLGLPDRKILFRHILPNALVPLTTFFPFSLVGAIGTLAALDYLGFGLPPPTASWGQLLAQAQGQAYWWLILYPSLALFLIILLCVFIGEGVRNAFDPRKFTRLE